MTNKDVILRSIKYIEANLMNELTVSGIARESHYSLYHFIRLFQNVTGFSPGSYLHQRRLTEAAKTILHTDKKVIEVAFDFRFNSHEAFSRAFRKQFGCNPMEVRSGIPTSAFPFVEPLSADFIFQSDKTRNQKPEIITLPEILLAGLSFFVSDFTKEHDFSAIWGQFIKEMDSLRNRIRPEQYYQIQYWLEKQEVGGMYFFIGVEIQNISETSPQFVIKTIPSGRYLRFIHRGFSNKVGYTYKYIYNQFLPETEFRLTLPFNFEHYGNCYKGPYREDSESEIFIPIE